MAVATEGVSRQALALGRGAQLASWIYGQRERMANRLVPLDSALSVVYKGLNSEEVDYEAPPSLEGNDLETINHAAIAMLAVVVVAVLLAKVWDDCLRRPGTAAAEKVRPKAWASALLICSFCLLIPGVFSCLISMSMVVNVPGYRINVHPESEKPSFTESSPGLAYMLYREGSQLGTASVVLFALVVPSVAAILVVLGELFRNRCGEKCNTRIDVAIWFAQHKAKWASPFMSALILLVCLVRSLNHPDLIMTNAQLDVGFFCFSCFCVGATASAIGFPEPKAEDRDCRCCYGPLEWFERLLSTAGRKGLMLLAAGMSGTFVYLLWLGCELPAMSISFTDQPLYPPQGTLPLKFKPAVDMLDIVGLLDSEVSFNGSNRVLWGWACEGEVNSAVGLAMLAVFTIGVPILDVVAVALLSWILYLGDRAGTLAAWRGPLKSAIEALKRMSMLDVSIAGIYVVSWVMLVFRSRGCILEYQQGHYYLHAAEVAHWMMHRFLSCLEGFERKRLEQNGGAKEGTELTSKAVLLDEEGDIHGGEPIPADGLCCSPSPRPWRLSFSSGGSWISLSEPRVLKVSAGTEKPSSR